VSVLLSETPEGKTRVNLRSKAPDVCGLDVDVAALAQSLGGGGHRRAAGARMTGSMEEVYSKVRQAVVAAVQAAQAND
ncbi:MAG TPA: DHHA1 domain-containing protein, partial [Phycisphaerae bacterium]|nr:DHHA1 domain-containing protein [Phycisphaerae bacterium]